MDSSNTTSFIKLFPWWVKYVGLTMILISVVGMYSFLYIGEKPMWLYRNVFTFYSEYIVSKTFTLINNHQGDEVSILLYFTGSWLCMASVMKNEKSYHVRNRYRAFCVCVYMMMLLFIVGYIFFHGIIIFLWVMGLILFVPILYLLIFYILNAYSVKKT